MEFSSAVSGYRKRDTSPLGYKLKKRPELAADLARTIRWAFLAQSLMCTSSV